MHDNWYTSHCLNRLFDCNTYLQRSIQINRVLGYFHMHYISYFHYEIKYIKVLRKYYQKFSRSLKMTNENVSVSNL